VEYNQPDLVHLFSVFMLQTVLIAMIIGVQWEQQHSTASHFIDVPFYQKDYLVASIDFARD
jgi:hypothetical protein